MGQSVQVKTQRLNLMMVFIFNLDDEDDIEDDQITEEELSEKLEKGLYTVEDVQKLVKTMLYNSSKPAKVKKLLRKLEATESISMKKKFLVFHGLLVLKSCLGHFSQLAKINVPMCYQILKCLRDLPIATRNSIADHKLDEIVSKLLTVNESEVVQMAKDVITLFNLDSCFMG